MRMVALTEFAEERQPEHVLFCRPFSATLILAARARYMFIIYTTTTLGSLCTKTSVAQCARVKDFCCVVDAITQRSSFVVVLPYQNFCWFQSANVR